MFPNADKSKHKFHLEKKALGLYFYRILDPAAVQNYTKFPSLITNVLLKLIEISSTEFITSIMKNVLSNRKVIQMLMFSLQKKIWKRNYN